MDFHSIDYENIIITDNLGKDWTVRFTREFTSDTYLYGADADGNRGELRTDIEDESFRYFEVRLNINIWSEVNHLCEEMKQSIVQAMSNWIKQHPAEVSNE